MQLPITDIVNVYRLTRTGNKEAFGQDPVATDLDCSIVPASTDIVALYGGNLSLALYEIFFSENVEVLNGDKLVSGAKEYIVRGTPMAINNRFLSCTEVVGELAL